MSEDSAGKGIRRLCVDNVLSHLISCNGINAKNLVAILRDDEIITKDQRKEYFALIDKGRLRDVVKKMADSATESAGGLNYLIRTLQGKELDLDAKVSDVLESILHADVDSVQLKLISLLIEITKRRDDTLPVIKDIWPDSPQFSVENWPLDFVHFCVMDADKLKVEKLVLSALSLSNPDVSRVTTEEDRMVQTFTGLPHEHCLGADKSLDEQSLMSDDLDSFVILDEEAVGESEEQAIDHKHEMEHFVIENSEEGSPRYSIQHDNNTGPICDKENSNVPDTNKKRDNLPVREETSTVSNEVNEEDASGKRDNLQVREETSTLSKEVDNEEDTQMRAEEQSMIEESSIDDPDLQDDRIVHSGDEEFSLLTDSTDFIDAPLHHSHETTVHPGVQNDPKDVLEPLGTAPNDEKKQVDNCKSSDTEESSTTLDPQREIQNADGDPQSDATASSNEDSSCFGTASPHHASGASVERDALNDDTGAYISEPAEDSMPTDDEKPVDAGEPRETENLQEDDRQSLENEDQCGNDNASLNPPPSYHSETSSTTSDPQRATQKPDSTALIDRDSSDFSSAPPHHPAESTPTASQDAQNNDADATTAVAPPPYQSDEGYLNPGSQTAVSGDGTSVDAETVPEAEDADLLYAEYLQIEEVKRFSSQDVNAAVSKTIELRAFFMGAENVKSRGFSTPTVRIGDTMYHMENHRFGYFSATLPLDLVKSGYLYCLCNNKKRKYFPEVLPSEKKRKIFTGEAAIIFDIADFDRSINLFPRHHWEKLVQDNIARYLPESDFMLEDKNFSCVDVVEWIKMICHAGWMVDDKCEAFKVSKKDMEQMLKNWLASIENRKTDRSKHIHIYKHILCSVAVVHGFCQLNYLIGNSKLFKRICNGLHIHQLTAGQQHELFGMICNNINSQPNVLCKSLEFFYRNLKTFTKVTCILSFPLYSILRFKGISHKRISLNPPDLLFYRAILPRSDEGNDTNLWHNFRSCVLEKPRKMKQIKDIHTTIDQIARVHPWMVDSYQFFLSRKLLMEILHEDKSLGEKFFIDSILTQLLPMLDPVACSKSPNRVKDLRKQITALSKFFTSKFKQLADPKSIQILDSDEKIYQAKSALYVLDLLEKSLNSTVNEKSFQKSATSCILWILTMASSCLTWLLHLNYDDTSPLETLNKILGSVITRISEFIELQNPMGEDEIVFYNTLFKKKWDQDNFQHKWNVHLKNEIERALNERWNNQTDSASFLQLYVVELEDIEFETILEELLRDKADECAAFVLNHLDESSMTSCNEMLNLPRLHKVFANAFLREFLRHSKACEGSIQHNALLFLAKSKMALRFYSVIDRSKATRLFSPSRFEVLQEVDNVANRLLENISKGLVTVEDAQVILDNESRILKLISFKNKKMNPTDLEKKLLFKFWGDNLKKHRERMDAFKSFFGFCSTLKDAYEVDCRSLQTIYDRKDSKLLIKNLEEYSIADKELDEIRLIHSLKESQIFWTNAHEVSQNAKTGNKDGETILKVTWGEILTLTWYKMRGEMLDFIQDLHEAKLFQDVLLKMFHFTEGELSSLEDELHSLYSFSSAAKNYPDGGSIRRFAQEKASQLSYVFKMETCKEMLEWFIAFQNRNGLTTNFEALRDFQGDSNELSKSQKKSLDTIFKMTGKHLEYFQKFSAQQLLIEWLQSKMTDGRQVREFCLMAAESSRHKETDADRLSFLSDAVAGFEELIFHLCDIKTRTDFLTRCHDVCIKVEDDQSILAKWTDVGENLDWYKENENMRESDDQYSSHIAQMTNSQGQYIIGHIEKTDATDATVNNFFKMEFSEESNNSNMQQRPRKLLKFGIEQLHDIKSVLMLRESDDQECDIDVLQFIQVFDAMESLARAYRDLSNAGFILFSDWTLIARSRKLENNGDLMSEHILSMQISFKPNIKPISKSGSVQDIIQLSELLRNELKRWETHIHEMRMQNYFLNDYSIQQIKYLCSQLGKFRQTPLEEQAYFLLSDLPQNVLRPLIQQSLVDVQNSANQEEGLSEYEDDDSNEELDTILQKQIAVRRLVNQENTSEVIAKAAVQAEGYQDYNLCSTWILLHEYDEDLIVEKSREFDQAVGFVHDASGVQEDVTALRNNRSKSLEGLIEILLERASSTGRDLLEVIKTVCTGYLKGTEALTLQDNLSVSDLGKFLTILHMNIEKQKTCPNRPILDFFVAGAPNLVITAEREVVSMVAYLYSNKLNTHDTETITPTLPTPQEVLICSGSTTSDEVRRFMLQAMVEHPAGKKLLFCMAFTEKLDFNVSKDLENVFGDLSQDKRTSENYQLVIISSDPNHFVANCFDQYRVEKTPEFFEKDVADYVKQNMARKTVGNLGQVEVVFSKRSGVGKSLHVERVKENMSPNCHSTTVRLLEREVAVDEVIRRLLSKEILPEALHLIHIDITPAVENGIEKFLFDLILLGMVKNSSGKIWRRWENHFYVVEITAQSSKLPHTLKLLPTVECLSPLEVLERLHNDEPDTGSPLLIDEKEYLSDVFQRPYQYLVRQDRGEDLEKFHYMEAKTAGNLTCTKSECIKLLVEKCDIKDPSWAQIKHFVSFLNIQLENCEKSVYMHDDFLSGLKQLAVKFMIKMAQDFATPSLNISDESSNLMSQKDDCATDAVSQYRLRRKWEEYDHPFMFFNDDGETMTFVNVNIDRDGHLRNKEKEIIEENIASPKLIDRLRAQGIDLGHSFHELSRMEMIERLCRIMGVEDVFDPDDTYELTTDNALKMIAIYMRLRCNIPVIVMGETGCGKTRMAEFMSKLQAGKDKSKGNMETLKVHGGTTVHDIFVSVKNAFHQDCERKMLFYDEANTTTAIYAIKEVMCDFTINGDAFISDHDCLAGVPKLQIVAACNPYKKLSNEALRKLEDAGLGYRVPKTETPEQLGNVAMRTLIYRVVALPPSIQPFVWDFGQLSDETEKIYIEKMVRSKLQNYLTCNLECNLVVSVLSHVQIHAKSQKSECRYVSLRDTERTIKLFKWFYKHKDILFAKIQKALISYSHHPEIPDILRCLLHAVGVAYYVSLEDRVGFRNMLSEKLQQVINDFSQSDLEHEFEACQRAFHLDLKADDSIAWNEALRENVFLMAVCADAKLPLYIIGKPGSSKSLAKSIVDANMKGTSSNSELFKSLKKVETIPFQCSAQTKASQIKEVFTRASLRQQKEDLKKFASLVVFDEIGLAEDSPDMPLKILHPLLECGNADRGGLSEYKKAEKVAFVGISNWSLDPAKMNRGIFVTRNTPLEKDLIKTAKGILGSSAKLNEHHTDLENLTKTYLGIYDKQGDQYFGLRDYYSSVKMIHAISKQGKKVNKNVISYVLARNFSGGTKKHEEVLIKAALDHFDIPTNFLNETSLLQLVKDNIESVEDRFLLLLTSGHSSVNLLGHIVPDFEQTCKVIYGSSFPGDQTYTVLCKNLSLIKLCMNEGKKVVLLNVSGIHESLYEILNQYYIEFGKQRYAAIGLGSHKVWTRIHQNFRLIMIEKKDVVQKKYPIPLLNRLEKHHLSSGSLLTEQNLSISSDLGKWAKQFSESGESFTMANVFVGSHEETVNSVLLAHDNNDIDSHKRVLLDAAAADAIFRLPHSKLGKKEIDMLMKAYMTEQSHDCLLNFLQFAMLNSRQKVELCDIVSFSNILTEGDRREVENKLNLACNSIMLLSLQQFKVEQEYNKKLDHFFTRCQEKPKAQGNNIAVLLVQTSKSQRNGQLIECAKHYLMNKLRNVDSAKLLAEKVIIAFILCTERSANKNGTGLVIQHTKEIKTVYVDELRHQESNGSTLLISSLYGKSLRDILDDKSFSENGECTNSYILCLLQDCLTEAMSKVSSTITTNGRQIERIKELRNLFQLTLGPTSLKFVGILLRKLIDFIHKPEHLDKFEWIVKEASSPSKLQVGGTFGRTMHLYLKRHIADMLAFIISIVDENNNLRILCYSADMEWKIELWLDMFSVLDMHDFTENMTQYIVKTPTHLNMNFSATFPFSFILHKLFLRCYESRTDSDDAERFFYNRVLQDEKVQKVTNIWDNSNGDLKIMEAYAHDVVKFQMKRNFTNQKELNCLTKILSKFSEKRNTLKKQYNGVAVTFYTFMEISEQLGVIFSVFKACPGLTENTTEWIEKQKDEVFLIHEHAFQDALEWTQAKVGTICDEQSSRQWMEVCSQMKAIYNHMVKPKCVVKMRLIWKPIDLVDALMLHLLPSDNDLEYSKYLNLVVQHARKLFTTLKTKDIHSKDVLKIITSVLRKCYEDLELNLKLQWQNPKCVCGNKIRKPFQMPCKCFICESCKNLIRNNTPICPRCTDPLPADFLPNEQSLKREDGIKLEQFRMNCTGFFLEYLGQYCFTENANEADADEKISAIISIVLPKDSSGQKKKFKLETTQLNMNMATKASVFSLVLNYRLNVTEEFKEIFHDARGIDNTLILTLLMGWERKLCEQEGVDKMLRFAWDELLRNQDERLDMEMLRSVAGVRFSVYSVVEWIERRRRNVTAEQSPDNIVLRAKDICSQKNAAILRSFISKTGSENYGKQWLKYIQTNDDLQAFVSNDIAASLDEIIDHWDVLGAPYVSLKGPETVRHLVQEIRLHQHVLCKESLPRFMAILLLNEKLSGRANRQFAKELHKVMGRLSFERDLLLSKEIKEHLILPDFAKCQQYAVYQAVMLIAFTALCKLPLMEELYRIVTSPEDSSEWFWPAMPQSVYEHVSDAMSDEQPYCCPRGHVYFIGDCTYPAVMSVCPQCDSAIGGVFHIRADGNERLPMHREKGYQLHMTSMGVQNPTSRLTQQEIALMHFFMHSCMLIALRKNSDQVLRMIQKSGKESAYQYFATKLCSNVEELSSGLGYNVDESIMIIHQILARMVQNEFEKLPQTIDWSTEEGRNSWEDEFKSRYLRPVFREADDYIADAKKKLSKSGQGLSHETEIPRNFKERLTSMHPALWQTLRQPTSAHLLHSIIDSSYSHGVLGAIVQTPNLHYVKHLHDILSLQQEFIQRFQNKKDINYLENSTFDRIQNEDWFSHEMRGQIDSYIEAWNLLLPTFQDKYSNDRRNNKLKSINKNYLRRMSWDSPLTMALPSCRGRGRCAKVLAEHLIDIQNEFLRRCEAEDKSIETIEAVEVPKLLASQVVCIDKQGDLLPLVHLHTSYSITTDEFGRHHRRSYNIPALEKQVKEKHVRYKKVILKQSLPCMKYVEDVGVDWEKVLENVHQLPLTSQMANEVEESIARVNIADICEAIRAVTQAISFLTKVKVTENEGTRRLRDYLENDLMLSASRLGMIPQTALICHTLALYQKLSYHKAVKFFEQGINPYKETLQYANQEKISDPAVLSELKHAFEHMDVRSLQEHVNELIIQIPDFNPEWELMSIFPNLNFIEESPSESWYIRLPPQLCFSHITDLFKRSVVGITDD